jgi:hypothetical protein
LLEGAREDAEELGFARDKDTEAEVAGLIDVAERYEAACERARATLLTTFALKPRRRSPTWCGKSGTTLHIRLPASWCTRVPWPHMTRLSVPVLNTLKH